MIFNVLIFWCYVYRFIMLNSLISVEDKRPLKKLSVLQSWFQTLLLVLSICLCLFVLLLKIQRVSWSLHGYMFRFILFYVWSTLSLFNSKYILMISVFVWNMYCDLIMTMHVGAFDAWNLVQKAGFKADCKLYTTLISTCAKSGKVDTMFEVRLLHYYPFCIAC